MINLLIKLLHRLRLVHAVWLRDMDGVTYLSIKHRDAFGYYWARVYPFHSIGHVCLKSDGTCDGESGYIKYWRDYE